MYNKFMKKYPYYYTRELVQALIKCLIFAVLDKFSDK